MTVRALAAVLLVFVAAGCSEGPATNVGTASDVMTVTPIAPDVIDDQFEDGVSGAWSGTLGGGGISLIPDPTGSFDGRQVAAHAFSIDAGFHSDQDRYRFFDGYSNQEVYVAIDLEFTDVVDLGAQRKLIYLKGDRSYGGRVSSWTVVLTAHIPNIILAGDDSNGFIPTEDVERGALSVDTPYRIELGVRVNDPGQANGWVRVWLTNLDVGPEDRTLVFESTGRRIDTRGGGSHDPYPDRIQVGDQLDNGGNEGSIVADVRIFDRMMISSTEIGTWGLGGS